MSLRRGDRLTTDVGVPRPRIPSLVLVLVVLVVAVVYGMPVLTTGDPLWPLPTDTHADALLLHWDRTDTRVVPADPRYRPLMDAVNSALRDIDGIEYTYGLRPDDVSALRSSGRSLESLYDRDARIHGPYSVGSFRSVLIPLDGPEFERRLIFFGDAGGYRAGPLRTRSLEQLRDRVRAALPSG